MSTAISARQRFLSEAAALLEGPAPILAGELRHDVSLIQNATGNAASGKGEPVSHCPACGSLGIITRTVDLKTSRRPKQTMSAREFTIRKCQTCSRSAKQPVMEILPSRAAVPKTSSVDQSPRTSKPTLPAGDNHGVGTKTSSKKRAKDRKDREGLKAMLDKNKAKSASAGSAFNLMDFLSGGGPK